MSWESDRWATAYDVYFGTAYPPEFVGTLGQRTQDPGVLDFMTGYYWRVDVKGPSGMAEGPVWMFETEANPIQARYPYPADGSEYYQDYVVLTWTAAEGAISHEVYFGNTDEPVFAGNQTQTSFDPGVLPEYGWYYWRVDEITAEGKVEGELWRFEYRTGTAR